MSTGIRRRVARAIAMVAVAAVAVTTLGACVPGNDTASSESTELRLYLGDIPEPAPLISSGMTALPEMPVPPTDFSDEEAMAEYQRAVEEYMKAIEELGSGSGGDPVEFAIQVGKLVEATRSSDEASVSAWQSLLVAAGIAVGYGGQVVEVSGMEGAGIPMTSAELRLHALLGAMEARMLLTELAGIIGAFGIFGDGDLTQALYDDLYAPADADFGIIFGALDPETFGTMRYGEYIRTPLEEVSLTGAQVGLVLRKLSVDLLVAAEEFGGIDTAAWEASSASGGVVTAALITEHAAVGSHAAAGEGSGCDVEEEPWELEARKNIGKALGWGFGEVLDEVLDKSGIGASTRLIASAAVAGLALASLATKMFSLEATFSMGNAPLVRSKDRDAGDRRTIAIGFSYPKDAMDDARNCAAKLLAPFGIDIADKTAGAATGIDVNLMLKGERLQYGDDKSGTDRYHQQTSQNGTVLFTVDGKAQKQRLPEGAEPEEVTSRVQADANIEGSDLVKDLVGAGWDAVGPGVAGILGSIASRMKLVSFVWDVPVRDWTLEAEFDMTLTGELWAHSGTSRGGVAEAPCGVWTVHRSSTSSGTITSQSPKPLIVKYVTTEVDGSPISGIVFHAKETDPNSITVVGGVAQLAHFPVDLELTRTESSPGADPMPEHYEEPGVSGCGDGNPDAGSPARDCGTRDFTGLATTNIQDGRLFVTSDGVAGDIWRACGSASYPQNPVAPPSWITDCANAKLSGGEAPSPDTVFSERGWFEVSGSMNCARDGDGSLERFTFDWTMKFCRVVDGKHNEC